MGQQVGSRIGDQERRKPLKFPGSVGERDERSAIFGHG